MGDEEKEELKGDASEGSAEEKEETKTGSESTDAAEEEDVKDSHGHPGINREKYERDMKAKDDEIANLKAEIAKAAETKEGREALEKRIADLEASQADERVTHKLEMENCVNVKAAKALLDDYDGDVAKLKAECPYLFESKKQSGSTGGKPAGATDDKEKRLADARKAAGITVKE